MKGAAGSLHAGRRGFAGMVLAIAMAGTAAAPQAPRATAAPPPRPAGLAEIALDDLRPADVTVHASALHDLRATWLPVGRFSASGGAIAQLGDDLLLATPDGLLVRLEDGAARTGRIVLRPLPTTIPMGWENAASNPLLADPRLNRRWLRVADILLVAAEAGGTDLYVSHHAVERNCLGVAVSHVRLVEGARGPVPDAAGWSRLFTAAPCLAAATLDHVFAGHQIGGRMELGADGRLLLALGDHGFDGVGHPWKAPLDPGTHLGKLVAIDRRTGAAEILAAGLRNPQGLLRTRDGRLIETEHGPRGGDEVNRLEAGRSYGWPEVTLGLGYGGPWPANPEQGRHTGHTPPLFAFVPSIAISSIALTDSAEFPRWRGDLLVASLRAQTLYRLRPEGARILYVEPVVELGERLRDLIELEDGRLAALTDSARVILIERARPGPSPGVAVAGLAALERRTARHFARIGFDSRDFGRASFEAQCAACHRLDPVHGPGPHLAGLVGRRIGQVDGFAFSAALAGQTGTWSPPRLLEFLTRPEEGFAGTTMPRVDLAPETVWPIVEFLRDRGG